MRGTKGNVNGKIYPQGDFNYDGWDKVYDSDDEGVSFPTSSITISGLDGDTDEEYMYDIVVKSGTNIAYLYFRFNGDSGSNYGAQRVIGNNTAITASRDVLAGIYTTYASSGNDLGVCSGKIYAKSGNERLVVNSLCAGIDGTSIVRVHASGQVWSNTADNIISITFYENTGSGEFASGTRIILWKKVSQ